MEIRIKGDAVEIEGYVNAIERESLPLWSRIGRFVERICKGAFKRALQRNDNVRILLNHNPARDLGGQRDGNLELEEDNIGLRVRTTITDPEVVQKARNNELVGWSFGFYDRDVLCETNEDGLPLRKVRDLDLEEVSILDNTTTPAYEGTLISVRSDKSVYFGDAFKDEIHLREIDGEEKTEEKDVPAPEEKPEQETPETRGNDTVPKQQETVEKKDKKYDEYKKLVEDMKN